MKRRPVLVAVLLGGLAAAPFALAQADPGAEIKEWFAAYDRAFNSKDLDRLATFYHPEVTIYEGGGINEGWPDYRDHHLGPELKEFENLQFSHAAVVPHFLDKQQTVAYVTSEYRLKARVQGRDVDGGGLETAIL